MKKRHWLLAAAAAATVAAALFACAAPAPAPAPPIPPELVGIWVEDGTQLRDGRWLVSGQALYLGEDGVGMVVGGPPPIGMVLHARYDPATHLLQTQLTVNGVTLPPTNAVYDPEAKTLDIGGQISKLKRRADRLDAATRRGLGL